MTKLDFKIELSETDIKIAIAEYIGNRYGLSMFTNGNFQKVKLSHETDTFLGSNYFEKPITTYNATFEFQGEN